jgi:DNA polymerase (family 10)
MISNKEIRRLLNLYAELLELHRKDARLAKIAFGSRLLYPSRPAGTYVTGQSHDDQIIPATSHPVIYRATENRNDCKAGRTYSTHTGGLFELMRIKGLGGKKLSVIWHTLKIDTMEGLLKACLKNKLSKVPGIGA